MTKNQYDGNARHPVPAESRWPERIGADKWSQARESYADPLEPWQTPRRFVSRNRFPLYLGGRKFPGLGGVMHYYRDSAGQHWRTREPYAQYVQACLDDMAEPDGTADGIEAEIMD